jgi:hypothetical protein
MTIRKLNVDDLNQLLELYVHLIPNDDPLPEKDAVCSIWSSICGNSDRLYFGVFEERMVSTCNLTIIPNLTRGCRPYGLIKCSNACWPSTERLWKGRPGPCTELCEGSKLLQSDAANGL